MRHTHGLCSPATWLTAYYALQVVSMIGASGEDVHVHLKDHARREAASEHEQLAERYVSDFSGLDRGIVGRQDDDIQSLSNNAPAQSNIEAGDTQYWTFPKSALQRSKSPKPSGLPSQFDECPTAAGAQDAANFELRKRQSDPGFYVTLNVCDQPIARRRPPNKAPNQLQLYISTDSTNSKPGESKHDHVVPVAGGYGSFNLSVNKDVFIAVTAPSNNDFTGIYNYEITASIDDHYAKLNTSSASRYVDSDKQSALIYTSNTTSCNSSEDTFHAWQDNAPPFRVFVADQDDPSILGLQNSMCGLKKHAQIRNTDTVQTSITLAGGGQPKQQFYISGLNASTSYYAIIALEGTDGNSSSVGGGKVNGGGTIWGTTNFTTKSSRSFALSNDWRAHAYHPQVQIALSYMILTSALKLRIRCRQTLRTQTKWRTSELHTISTLQTCTKIFRSPCNKFLAIRQIQHNIRWRLHARIVQQLTRIGYARSRFPVVKTFPITLRICCRAQQVWLLLT